MILATIGMLILMTRSFRASATRTPQWRSADTERTSHMMIRTATIVFGIRGSQKWLFREEFVSDLSSGTSLAQL